MFLKHALFAVVRQGRLSRRQYVRYPRTHVQAHTRLHTQTSTEISIVVSKAASFHFAAAASLVISETQRFVLLW